jgi:hypothetical protein
MVTSEMAGGKGQQSAVIAPARHQQGTAHRPPPAAPLPPPSARNARNPRPCNPTSPPTSELTCARGPYLRRFLAVLRDITPTQSARVSGLRVSAEWEWERGEGWVLFPPSPPLPLSLTQRQPSTQSPVGRSAGILTRSTITPPVQSPEHMPSTSAARAVGSIGHHGPSQSRQMDSQTSGNWPVVWWVRAGKGKQGWARVGVWGGELGRHNTQPLRSPNQL